MEELYTSMIEGETNMIYEVRETKVWFVAATRQDAETYLNASKKDSEKWHIVERLPTLNEFCQKHRLTIDEVIGILGRSQCLRHFIEHTGLQESDVPSLPTAIKKYFGVTE